MNGTADAFQVRTTTAQYNKWSLLLIIVPLTAVFGNLLVIVAVQTVKTLKTVTNLLILSLAVADLLVALCVMSFAIYFEFNSFVWRLGPLVCNIYMAADVCCSTASILNLFAISLDRYTAINYPIEYAQYGTNQSRVQFLILLVWSLSIAVGLPIIFGKCLFTNAIFIITSSLLSFFLPCGAMIVLYAIIFHRLAKRRKYRIRCQVSAAARFPDNSCGTNTLHRLRGILRRCFEKTKNDIAQDSSFYTIQSGVDALQQETSLANIVSERTRSFGDNLHEKLPFIDAQSLNRSSTTSSTPSECTSHLIIGLDSALNQKNNDQSLTVLLTTDGSSDCNRCRRMQKGEFEHSSSKFHSSAAESNSRISKVSAMRSDTENKNVLNMRRGVRRVNRERKATITLSVVLGAFLICWLPFFVLHLKNAICILINGSDCVEFIAFFFTTWLGYFNSSLNPLIYTIFDQRFRNAFRQILLNPIKSLEGII